jgi:hypothetical protein
MNFAAYFAGKSIEPEIRKRLFRPDVVMFGNYIATYSTAIYFGSAFGITFANHKDEALRLYSNAGHEAPLLESCSLDVSSIKEICDAEDRRMRAIMHQNRTTPLALDAIWNAPIPANDATKMVAWAFVYSTILGSRRSEMIEQTWDGPCPLEEAKRVTKKLLKDWLTDNNIRHGFLTSYFEEAGAA